MAENISGDAPPAKKNKLKRILLLVFLIVLAIGLAVAATLWFRNGSLPGMATGEVAEEQVKELEYQPSVYLKLEKPLLAMVQTEGRQRYVQIYAALEAESQVVLDAADLHMPLLRSQLVQLMGSRNFDALRTPQGREELAEEMTKKVNELLANEGGLPIRHLLFTNFVVQ